MIRKILVVGGANGIGLAIAHELASRESTEIVYVVDKAPLIEEFAHPKIRPFQFDLTSEDYSFFDRFSDINALMVTAGFGRLSFQGCTRATYHGFFQREHDSSVEAG